MYVTVHYICVNTYVLYVPVTRRLVLVELRKDIATNISMCSILSSDMEIYGYCVLKSKSILM